MRPDRRDLARRIALVMLDDPIDEATLRLRMMRAFRPITPWLVDMAVRLSASFVVTGSFARDRNRLVEHILVDPQFEEAATPPLPRLRHAALAPAASPTARLPVAGLPAIESTAALASWLGLTRGELIWLADRWRQDAARIDGPLHHYRYEWRSREYGPDRLIEIPKRRLRTIQRRIDAHILRRIPLHDAAHGFVGTRSAVTHARLHAGRDWVLRIDLEQFFAGIGEPRVRGVFRLIGYADAVARDLSALCTNRVPTAVLHAPPHRPLPWPDQQRYRSAHLPQGAPTSPALANVIAWQLDARLAAWARHCGLTYSRYADDLTFSGDGLARADVARVARVVATIAEDCGFRVNHRKTSVLPAHRPQRVTGIVVNRHANIARADFDRMKAILTNSVRYGHESQNLENRPDFRAWLHGMLAWYGCINPQRTAKLRRTFAEIVW